MGTCVVRRSLVLLAFTGVVVMPAAPGAQAPTTPDLLGIHAGMPASAARATLQKRAPQVVVQPDSPADTGFTLSINDPENRDMVHVYLTMAPNDPAVWMIQRTQNFYPQNPMSKTALLSALHEKYGKETLTARGGSYLYWIFDQNGRVLASADEGLTACTGGNFVNLVRNGPPPSPNPVQLTCFRSFNAVIAMLNNRDQDLLEAYTIELVNLPYAFRAATVTGSARNSDAEKARQELLNKANQKKPAL